MTAPAPLSARELDMAEKLADEASFDGRQDCADMMLRLIAEVREHQSRSTLAPASGGVVAPNDHWLAKLHEAEGLRQAAEVVEMDALGAPSIALKLRRLARRTKEEAEMFLAATAAVAREDGEG